MTFEMLNPPRPSLAALLVCLSLLGGCTITPTPVSDADIKTRVATDRLGMFVEQEPVTRAISFNEAVARAVKYNLDYRLKMMETALSGSLADVGRYEMLPKLLASAGYSSRNNDSGGRSINIETGQESLTNSTSQERQHLMASTEFSWNVLDFGVSYYRARQQANQVLIAEERRMRVVQNILQEVRSAYWRAVGAQRLERKSRELVVMVQEALDRTREAERQGLVSPKNSLESQRMLLDALAVLHTRQQELAYAKLELAALMSLSPGTVFTLEEQPETELPAIPTDLSKLDLLALEHRPELREEDYRVRLSSDEARRQLLSLLPGVTFSTALQYDSNGYLYNNGWSESGLRVGMDFLRLLALPAINRASEAQTDLDAARRQALGMAVLVQSRVAIERYRLALDDLSVVRESSDVDRRMADFAQAALTTRTDSEMALIRARTKELNSEYQRYAAYATAQTAFARIYNSVGLGVLPERMDDLSISELATEIGNKLTRLEGDAFPKAAAIDKPAQGLRLRMDTRALERLDRDRLEVTRTAAEALKGNHIPVVEGAAAPQLYMTLSLKESSAGLQQADWEMRMLRADGASLGTVHHASTLSARPTDAEIAALTEAAIVANLSSLEKWLREGSR